MQKRLLTALFIACIASVALAGASPVAAQEPGATPAPGAAEAPAAAPAGSAATAAPAAVTNDAPYRSAMRSQCEDEMAKDADWRADVKLRLAPDVHAEDAQQMLTNRRHVVMAYAALWVLVAGFVVFMWMRQRGLQAEIARLEREIIQATKDA